MLVGGRGGVSPYERRERGDRATRDDEACFVRYLGSTPKLGTDNPLHSLSSPLTEVVYPAGGVL